MNIESIAKVTKFREDLPFLFNQLGLTGLGVEVGVQRGSFSKHLLEHWHGAKLYLVDAWRTIEGYQDVANADHNAQLDNMAATFMAVYHYKERATIIRELSKDAVKLFEDCSLDFVFIDADHSYAGAKQDIALWEPKVRKGGVLCGHDYLDSPIGENNIAEFGVKTAVNEWAQFTGHRVYSNEGSENFPFWWAKV